MKNITVIGSLNMDLTTFTDKVPQVGETLMGTEFRASCGGKGGNQAYAIAKLGGSVNLLGCVGNDDFGASLVCNLKKTGVDCRGVGFSNEHKTGIACITVCQGDNSIIIVPGANYSVSPQYIKKNLNIVDCADLIILQLEIPLETVAYVCRYAKSKGIPVMLNPSPALPLPGDVLKHIEYLILNMTECSFYTGINIENIDNARAGVCALLRKGCKNVIVTLGKLGSVYNSGDLIYHEPAREVAAIDSTAAGDTFTAAVAEYLIEGYPISEAIIFATKASAISVTRHGAQCSMPTREEVYALY